LTLILITRCQSGELILLMIFFTGSPSAVCGGVTTFIEYADLLPGGDLADSLEYRMSADRENPLSITIFIWFSMVVAAGVLKI
jgi:dihydroorotase-like cyclic amidohydrolase